MYKITKDINVLRNKSTNVSSVEEAKMIIENLQSVLSNTNDGIGLSAIQIGIAKRVSVVKWRNSFINIINPSVMENSEDFIFVGEGCLSMPGVYVNTKRFKHFIIENNVIDGDSFRKEQQYFYFDPELRGKDPNGLTSIAVQHEIDHFDGILMVDKVVVQKPQKSKESIGRNELCPCGSGKKYKKCCLLKV